MENCCKTLTLIAISLYVFISCKAMAFTTANPCSLLQECNCQFTSDNAYEYQCPFFAVLFRNTNEANIKCDLDQFINHTDINSLRLNVTNLEKLTIVKCPVGLLLNSFNTLSNLKILSVMENIKESVESDKPFIFPNLNSLEINFSQINLTDELFNSNLALKRLSLSQNSLKWIPENIFKSITRLVHLDLSNNEISILPDTVFLKLRSLSYLNLRMNKLNTINSKLFYDLQSLETLDLSHNEIIRIHIEAFQRLINLRVANLSNNFVEFDGFSPFYSNLNLEQIDLSYNRISHMVNDLVINKIYLEELNLSFNHIDRIELSNLLTVSQHPKIDLQNNKVAILNFTNAYLLEQLNALDNIDIQRKFHAVTIVKLNHNPIICDCRLYDFIKFLHGRSKIIQFEINKATCTLPQQLKGFHLTKLKLELLTCWLENVNCPDVCRCSYRQWDNAIIVDCSKRNLSVVPDLRMTVDSNIQKIEVHLEENCITNGPEQMNGYENVSKLVLSHNQIQNISWMPSNLEVLEMEYNNITFLSYEVLLQINSPRLKRLVLGNNPWKCDCAAISFNSLLLAELTTKQIDVSKIQCSDTQKLLVYYNSHDLCSLNKSNISIIALIISVALLGLSGVVIYKMIYNSRKKLRPKRSRII